MIVARSGEFYYGIGAVDNDGRQPYFLTVGRKAALPLPNTERVTEIDRVNSLNESPFEPWSSETIGSKIVDLYDLAIRDASGTPQLFEELLESLSSIDDSQPPF